MMLLRARDNNIQSFACIWLHKGNQNEFLKLPPGFSEARCTQNFECKSILVEIMLSVEIFTDIQLIQLISNDFFLLETGFFWKNLVLKIFLYYV